jgi:hypothetical protein
MIGKKRPEKKAAVCGRGGHSRQPSLTNGKGLRIEPEGTLDSLDGDERRRT